MKTPVAITAITASFLAGYALSSALKYETHTPAPVLTSNCEKASAALKSLVFGTPKDITIAFKNLTYEIRTSGTENKFKSGC